MLLDFDSTIDLKVAFHISQRYLLDCYIKEIIKRGWNAIKSVGKKGETCKRQWNCEEEFIWVTSTGEFCPGNFPLL